MNPIIFCLGWQWLCLAVMMLGLGCPARAFAVIAGGSPGDLVSGQFIYTIRCANCHGVEPVSIGPAASLVQLTARLAGTIPHGGGQSPFDDVRLVDLGAWISSRDTNAYWLAGLVLNGHGDPRPGVSLTVCSTYLGYAPRQTFTAADGGFRVDGLPPGDHRVTPSAPALRFTPSNWIATVTQYAPSDGDILFLAYGTNEPPPTVPPRDLVQHVRPDGDDNNSGRSWLTARRTVAAGLAGTRSGGEVWVAEGIYYEKLIVDGRALYGGFSGTEARRAPRDWRTHPVILDADPDALAFQGIGPGSVVTLLQSSTNTPWIDGFTL